METTHELSRKEATQLDYDFFDELDEMWSKGNFLSVGIPRFPGGALGSLRK
jgi:hypothetical protein